MNTRNELNELTQGGEGAGRGLEATAEAITQWLNGNFSRKVALPFVLLLKEGETREG